MASTTRVPSTSSTFNPQSSASSLQTSSSGQRPNPHDFMRRSSLPRTASTTPSLIRGSQTPATPTLSTGTTTGSGRRSRPASSIGASEGHQIICAVGEARGVSPSVGMAFINVSTGEAVLSQICDNQSYVKTTHKLTVFEPSRILIVSTACPPNHKSSLYATIEEELPGVPIVPLDRRYWSETAGLEFIQALAFKEDVDAIKVAIEGNFYATCSFSAVMKYLELEFSMTISSHSLRIKYQPSEESMMISLPTIQSLELIQNLQDPSSKACLFGLLNETKTPMGKRMLRSNVLQPSTQTEGVLTPRYDAVEELCTKEDMFFQVRNALKVFGDVEKLLTKMILLPTEPSLQASEQAINEVLMIKSFVAAVPGVFGSLATARSTLLIKIREHCRPGMTNPILERMAEVINDDVTYVTKPLDLRNQRVYAVKSGVQGLLDVARTTYKEATEDLHKHVEGLNSELGLAADLKFDNQRRYWLQFRCADFENGLIPNALINCVRKKEYLECQTLQMVKLNQRMTDSVDEVIMQSDKVVRHLLDSIRTDIPQLFRVCESIALLDMLAAFGQTVTTRDYTRPQLKDALALKAARHPIFDSTLERFIPNDYYATEQHAFQIITGCNMSGKSTYIRTVAMLQVMAQIGCFVPAQFASFTIVHNLFSRTSTDDSIELNMSTFSVEMRDMAFILGNINNKSLAIIDELGRGTSTRDGLAIAIAMAEALVQSNALVFFATHFTELAQVLQDRPGVLNLHLETETTVADDNIPQMTMLYKVGSGPVQDENYGIKLARAIGFPNTFLDRAEDAANFLRRQAEAKKQSSESRRLARRRKLILNLRETLQQACDSDMGEETLRGFLLRLQSEFITRMEDIEKGAAAEVEEESEKGTGSSSPARDAGDLGKTGSSVISISDDGSSTDYGEMDVDD
ncbi:MutS domain V [Diaporthe amygdali]|uniref:MutS domain V n=1 Tax=Phomopsis amygdali TaxID=1214568 RepID=UPI0022FDD470|nr:MutS domain V [Diaporthe amygdali]KAJ0120584.1 MutS domain V [Diaporthe amygdali]